MSLNLKCCEKGFVMCADKEALLTKEVNRLKLLLDDRDEEIRQLREALKPITWVPPATLNLTKGEAAVFAVIYKARGNVISRERIHYALYNHREEDPEIRVIDTFLYKVRKKLEVYGITIKTHTGCGYYLTPFSLTIIDGWKNEQSSLAA